jgi:hypothetical protein
MADPARPAESVVLRRLANDLRWLRHESNLWFDERQRMAIEEIWRIVAAEAAVLNDGGDA